MREMQSLRYVVLWHHEIEAPHFDFMVETTPGSSLATWRLPAWPVVEPADVLRLKDHRAAFLTFQGELTASRGKVVQMAQGTCEVKSEASQWTIHFLEPKAGGLQFRHLGGDAWYAVPL